MRPRPLSICLLSMVLLAAACSEPRRRPPPNPGQDGGSAVDTGVTVDTGVASDGGANPDAGETPDAGPMVDPLSEAELTRRVTTLASEEWQGRNEGSAGHAAARAWIIEELTRCGVTGAAGGSFEQPITGTSGINVLGLVSGTSMAARTVIISAHYDHLGPCGGGVCLGADDNAAGVAIAIGTACALAQETISRSVLVALWDAEEPPTFLEPEMGSQFYADNPVRPLADTDAVLVMDLVGGDIWPGFENHFVFGAEMSPELDAALNAAPPPAGVIFGLGGYHLFEITPLGNRPLSDYYPFRVVGKPTLFFTNGQNKNYHRPTDVVGQINFPKVTQEAAYFLAVTRNLANATATPTFDANGANYARDTETILPVLRAALAPGGMADLLGIAAPSRNNLQADLSRLEDLKTRLDAGQSAQAADVDALRSATQRINCLTGTDFSENLCNLL